MDTVDILGIPFARLDEGQALDTLEGWLGEPKNHVIVTPNPEAVMQARRNSEFAEALQSADISLADGTGIILASYILRNRLPGRVRGVDTIYKLFERLNEKVAAPHFSNGNRLLPVKKCSFLSNREERKFTAYFLGGKPGVAELAKTKMEERFPHLSVVGFHHGFFSDKDESEILARIQELSPDILLICIGMPRAEIWVSKNRDINARLTMCLGGTIDIMAGTVKLTPSFIRRLGLEWLYRLIRQPSRIRRQLDIPRFVMAVLFEKFRTSSRA